METNKFVDLAKLDTADLCDTGAELELLHPGSSSPLGVFITLAGVDSRAYRQALADIAEKRTRTGARGIDEVRKEDIELASRCALGWRNVWLDGENLSFSIENARLLFGRFPWMREQALAFIASRANFLRD